MSQVSLSSIYNPDNQTKGELTKGFVIRLNEFKRINRDILDCNLNSVPQHFMIEGQRGMGKTSLLLRLLYSIQDSQCDWLIVVRLPEEQYNIFDLCRLWETVADDLEEEAGFKGISQRLEMLSDDEHYATMCFEELDRTLQKADKRLVLLLDNFGDMLAKLPQRDGQRLRDILHRTKRLQIVGATTHTLEAAYKYDKPFFEFFKKIRLTALDNTESIRLLRTLGERYDNAEFINSLVERHPERIETLRRITGGVPRTLLLLYEIFIDDSVNVFADLEALLDKVTPLYKHRMDDLPPQQQAIVDALAMNWDGLSSSGVSSRLKRRGLESKKIAAQLKLLEKSQLVESRLLNKKDKLYFVRERFFNIWYLMRYGRRRDTQQVKWLVRFLQDWCTPQELEQKAHRFITTQNDSSQYPRGRFLMTQALAESNIDAELKRQLLKTTISNLGEHHLEYAKDLRVRVKELDTASKLSSSEFGEIRANEHVLQKAIANGEYDKLVDLGLYYLFEKEDVSRAHDCFTQAVEKGIYQAFNNLGILYAIHLKDYPKAEQAFLQAIEKGVDNALYNLGNLYANHLNDYPKAEQAFLRAIEKNVDNALYNLGVLYAKHLNDYPKAEQAFLRAIEKGDQDALNNLGLLYIEYAKNRREALDLSERLEDHRQDVHTSITIAAINLWNENFDKSIEFFNIWLSFEPLEQYSNLATSYLLLLLAKEQPRLCLKLFELHSEFKDRFKPIYFALMQLLKNEHPKEHLKAGKELDQTIEEILARVEKMAEKYRL